MSDDLPESIGPRTSSEVRVSRSPRYARFMIAGFIASVVVSLILTFGFPQNPDYTTAQVFGFLLLFTAIAGVTLGAVAAIVIDRIATHRARTVLADRIDVRVIADEHDNAEPHTQPGEASEER